MPTPTLSPQVNGSVTASCALEEQVSIICCKITGYQETFRNPVERFPSESMVQRTRTDIKRARLDQR